MEERFGQHENDEIVEYMPTVKYLQIPPIMGTTGNLDVIAQIMIEYRMEIEFEECHQVYPDITVYFGAQVNDRIFKPSYNIHDPRQTVEQVVLIKMINNVVRCPPRQTLRHPLDAPRKKTQSDG